MLEYFLRKVNLTYDILLKTSFRHKAQFDALTEIPKFYTCTILAYNFCKYIKPVHKLTNTELLSQSIWGNEYFKVKGKTLFFSNWIESGFLYVKDLLNNDGTWLKEHEFILKLQKKNNWIAELMMLKKSLSKYLNGKELSDCKYIQDILVKRTSFITHSKIYTISEDICSTKFFYTILRNKKHERPHSEKMWARELNLTLQHLEWRDIYQNIITSTKYKKFSEFKFKIIHNILPCGKLISKWEKTKSRYCSHCGEIETIQHLLFECNRIKDLWTKLSKILQLDIQLKHIILGLKNLSAVNEIKSIVIVTVMYATYCTWVKCSFDNLCYNSVNLYQIIKEYIVFYCNVFVYMYKDVESKNCLTHYKEQICKAL